MAKQLNLLAEGQIIPTALHLEMERSYLEYAMSVIVGRALPDIRDGLKPVHRRILYAMYELGLTPDRPYRKCARVVGDVLGKYHPHGDQSVYDALVRMVQTFSSRYPLLAGHGNFGSVDDDPPAAMRYTETRLSSVGYNCLLEGVSQAVVEFTNNFDNSQQEPVVLPAQLPILLLNGCSGIAVGMATNIPPHNLAEVVDGLIALIDNPELGDEQLHKIIPGPDFPTGGEIRDVTGIKDAYTNGRGTITVRGITQLEQIVVDGKRRREKTAIVVTELPFQVNKSAWIEKVADLVNQSKIEGIADLRDESDRQGMRVVIELKKDADHQRILQSLYQQTALESNFGAIFLALVDYKPLQVSLKTLLNEFLKFREETLRKKYSYQLEQSQQRLHLVNGLIVALENLPSVIRILTNSADGSTASVNLQSDLSLSSSQADSVLAMPLRRLTGLEREKLHTESNELQIEIEHLQTLLNQRHELLKSLKKELRGLKKQFADVRRTRIVEHVVEQEQSIPIQKSLSQATVLSLSITDKLTWHSGSNFKEPVVCSWNIPTDQQALLFLLTETGKAFAANLEPRSLKPQTINSLLPKSCQNEKIISYFLVPRESTSLDLILLSSNGRLKRMPMKELESIGSSRAVSLMKFKEQEYLGMVSYYQSGQSLVVATSRGRILNFGLAIENLSSTSRAAQGIQALSLSKNEQIVGCQTLKQNEEILLVSQQGYLKRLSLSPLRICKFGETGMIAMPFLEKNDQLIAMLLSSGNILFLTSLNRTFTIAADNFPLLDRSLAGELMSQLKPGETIKLAQHQNLNHAPS
ncbi:MAG: DNA topoisomerase (ATP-hydrolyzing) [Cyanobacteriota bacterium ELA615]